MENTDTDSESQKDARLAYEPPRILWQEALETRALAIACAKVEGGCPGIPGGS